MKARWVRAGRFGWVHRSDLAYAGPSGIETRRSLWLWLWASK